MTVSFEYEKKIIANAELDVVPTFLDTVKIWGKEYEVEHSFHEVEIKMKPSGKKSEIKKIICRLKEKE